MARSGRRPEGRERARAPGAGGGTWPEAMDIGLDMYELGRYEEAVECLGEAMELGGDHVELYVSMGHALLGLGRTEEAMSHYDRAIEADPHHTTALLKKAESLLALNRVEEARVWCGRAIESGPKEGWPHHAMGNIYARLRDYEAAIAEFGEAVRIDPANFRGHANMGTAHLNAGRPEEALRCLDAALRLNPEYAFAHCQRAVALSRLGREDESHESWEKAIEHDPRYMLGDARRHLRADRQAELSRAGWRGGRPPKGLGRVRMPTGRSKARSEKGRERDLTMARVKAACELEGVSMYDAIRVVLTQEGPGGRASIIDSVREMRAAEEGELRESRGGRGAGGRQKEARQGGNLVIRAGGRRGTASKRIYRGRIVGLSVHNIRVGGRATTREIVEHPGAAAVLPFDGDGRVVLVRQDRYPHGEALEVPAGTLERGEKPRECAIRELQEETGYRASRMSRLLSFYPAIGYNTEIIHCYVATGLRPAPSNPDDDEKITVVRMGLDRLMSMIRTGRIKDSKTICSVLTYAARGGRPRG